MKAKNGIEIEVGQTWISSDGEFTSHVVGFSTAGYPVLEKGAGWPVDEREFIEIEKYWKSMFLDTLVSNTAITGRR